MEKFNYYFNTRNRIDAVLNEPVTKANMSQVLFNLVWDAYYNVSQNESDIIDYVVSWMKEKSDIFHLSTYAKVLRGYIKKVKKMPWRSITGTVKVRKSELDYISSFNDIKKEKVLFCYLAVAKFKDMSREQPTHWEDENDIAIFKMAKVPIPAKDRDYFVSELINGEQGALISWSHKNDDTSKRIDYISDDEDDPVMLELDESNYYELAFTYLNWKEGGGYKKCKRCGRLFRANTDKACSDKSKTNGMNRTQYCRQCSPTYEPEYKGKDEAALDYEPKKIICVDCGKEVYLDSYMASKTCRCTECQKRADYTPVETKAIVCVDCGKESIISSKDTRTIRCTTCNDVYQKERNRIKNQEYRNRTKDA